ncbi:hypothetical protein P4V74_08775 [Bacillus thuringiensis]|nr:hypothetical protein [Bacillus thuringiensis]
MDSRRLAQKIIEKQCDNAAELIRVKEALRIAYNEIDNEKGKQKLNNAISKLDKLIETL